MNFAAFILLFVTLPIVGMLYIGIGLFCMIGYSIACTIHLLYVRICYGKWVEWQLLYPRK
jgi:hypothetical protein